jgi:hypothetical protein
MLDDIAEIPADVVELVPESVAREICVMPFALEDGLLSLYCADDDADTHAQSEDRLRFILDRSVRLHPLNRIQLCALIDHYYADIQNCPVKFRFRCPRTWQSLIDIGQAGVRHCPQCNELVYWCDSYEQAQTLGKQKYCVAFRTNGSMLLGDVAVEFDPH